MATSELSVMLTAKGNLEQELRTARDRVKDLDQQIKKANASGERVSDKIADEYRQATREAKRLSDQVKRTNSEIKKTSAAATGNIARLGGAIVEHQTAIRNAGLLAAGALALLVKSSVSSASSLNESLSKTNAVFGDSAAEIIKWSESSAKAFGQSQNQALEAAGTYGNLFQAFGVGRDEAAKMSTSLTELAADLASFNNTSIDDAIIALRSGLSGETEPLKRYGAVLSDVRLKEKAVALQLISTTSDALTPAIKAQAAYALVMEDTVLAQGDFARTAGDLANSTRITAAEFENAKAALGKDLMPIMRDATKLASTLLSAFTALPGPVRNIMLALAGLTAAIMIFTPRIIAMKAHMVQAGIGAGSMKNGLKSAASFMTGPWGAAIAVAAAGLMLWINYTMAAKARVDELKGSIDAVTGSFNEVGTKSVMDTLVGEIDPEHWKYLDSLGLGLDEAMKAIQGTEAEMTAYVATANKANVAIEKQGISTGVLTNNVYDWWKAASRARNETEAVDGAMESMGISTGNAADDLGDLGDEADTATTKVSGLARAINNLTGAVSRQRALTDFKKAIKESVTKPSKDAAYEVIDNFDAAFKTFKNGGAKQAQFVIDNYDSVEDAVQKSGLSKKLQSQLIKPLQDAKSEADKVLAALNRVDGSSITINWVGGKPPSPVRRAAGGPVFGSGTATSDSIPAMLSNGEYVLRAAAVRSIGMMNLDALNRSGKMVDPNVLARLASRSREGELTPIATGPMVGEIHVHNPAHDVDVERAVTRGLAKARRIQQERGTRG